MSQEKSKTIRLQILGGGGGKEVYYGIFAISELLNILCHLRYVFYGPFWSCDPMLVRATFVKNLEF